MGEFSCKKLEGKGKLLEIYVHSSDLRKCSKFEGTLARFSALDSSIYALCDIQNCRDGTGTESYDAAFNYRVNNELNFRGQLHSFGKYFSVKGTRICYIFLAI